LANAPLSTPQCWATLWRARTLSWSRVHPAFATPIIGMSRVCRLTRAWSAGKICLYARSPVAPKKTIASECDMSTSHRSQQYAYLLREACFKEHLVEDSHRVEIRRLTCCAGGVWNWLCIRVLSGSGQTSRLPVANVNVVPEGFGRLVSSQETAACVFGNHACTMLCCLVSIARSLSSDELNAATPSVCNCWAMVSRPMPNVEGGWESTWLLATLLPALCHAPARAPVVWKEGWYWWCPDRSTPPRNVRRKTPRSLLQCFPTKHAVARASERVVPIRWLAAIGLTVSGRMFLPPTYASWHQDRVKNTWAIVKTASRRLQVRKRCLPGTLELPPLDLASTGLIPAGKGLRRSLGRLSTPVEWPEAYIPHRVQSRNGQVARNWYLVFGAVTWLWFSAVVARRHRFSRPRFP